MAELRVKAVGTVLHPRRPPLHRAPRMSLGFPGMYNDREWSSAMAQLSDPEKLRKNITEWKRPGPLSEVQLMWSRDGSTFELSASTFMPPGFRTCRSREATDSIGLDGEDQDAILLFVWNSFLTRKWIQRVKS